MTDALAAEALRSIGSHDGVTLLASGMSSHAWVGVVDGVRWVVRVPVADGRRPLPRYEAESRLLAALGERGVPVAPSGVVEVEGRMCSVARLLDGRRVMPSDWSDALVGEVAQALAGLHAMAPDLAVEHDLVARFHLARIWPFDDSQLLDHPVADRWPELVRPIAARRADVLTAGLDGAATVVHSDLHPDHLLLDGDGRLVGVLDFGDAFAGAAEWDLACMRYYHGRRIADAVRSRGSWRADAAELLGVAFALYKLDKTPERGDVAERVEPMLRAIVT